MFAVCFAQGLPLLGALLGNGLAVSLHQCCCRVVVVPVAMVITHQLGRAHVDYLFPATPSNLQRYRPAHRGLVLYQFTTHSNHLFFRWRFLSGLLCLYADLVMDFEPHLLHLWFVYFHGMPLSNQSGVLSFDLNPQSKQIPHSPVLSLPSASSAVDSDKRSPTTTAKKVIQSLSCCLLHCLLPPHSNFTLQTQIQGGAYGEHGHQCNRW